MSVEQIFTALFVAFIGGILGGSATIWNNEKKIKADLFAQSSKTYKELITSERIKWLGLLRESLVDFLAKLLFAVKEKRAGNNLNDVLFYDLVRLNFLIQLRLNASKDSHSKLLQEIGNLLTILDDFTHNKDTRTTSEEIAKLIGYLSIGCQQLLKEEWNQVKTEAKELYK